MCGKDISPITGDICGRDNTSFQRTNSLDWWNYAGPYDSTWTAIVLSQIEFTSERLGVRNT